MNTLRLLVQLFREFPSLFALRLERFTQAEHRPEVIDGQHYCLRCMTSAPCPPLMASLTRAMGLRQALADAVKAGKHGPKKADL